VHPAPSPTDNRGWGWTEVSGTGNDTDGVEPVISWPLRKSLWLADCRFTNEVHNLRWVDWLGYDIACERGVSFNVNAPKVKDVWLVSNIGYDANCGNYMVLKHADLYFHFCHTVLTKDIKIWDRVNAGDTVGNTNVSGESTGMHLHVNIIQIIWGIPHFVSSEYLFKGKGEIMDARPLLDMYPTISLKSKPPAVKGWA
jgi:hypothetical protein